MTAESVSAESLPAKRKRGQTLEQQVDEKENVAKPPSRVRRSTSARPSAAPPSKSRQSTRSKVSLPDVAESENEEQSDAPPPVKKARPFLESKAKDVVKVEEEEQETIEVKPKRGRRAASIAKTTRAADMEVDEDAPSKTTGRRTSTRKGTVSSGSRISAASTRSGEASGSARIEEAASEEEDVKPTKGRRAPAKATRRAPSKAIQSDDEEAEDAMPVASEQDDDEDVKPARKGRKPKAPVARKGKAAAKKPVPAAVIEESDEDLEPPSAAQPRRKSTPPKADASQKPANGAPEEEEEEEEEKSLFEPPPIPAAPTMSQPIPEEPTGPKSRLVIHKMALINFKSYAGRQEIGPFHKVRSLKSMKTW